MAAKQASMQVYRGQRQRSRHRGGEHQEQVDGLVEARQPTESGLEGNRQQKSTENLGAGLGDPHLLQQLIPVAVHPLVDSLVPAVVGIDVALLIPHAQRITAWRRFHSRGAFSLGSAEPGTVGRSSAAASASTTS